MANFAYIRVSPADRGDTQQINALKDFKIDEWFQEELSVKERRHPKLQEMLRSVKEGDTVYINDFSRIAKTTIDLWKIIEELENKNAHIISLKESFDTSSTTGKQMLDMMSIIADFERDIIFERQREGIAVAKAAGKYKGRAKVVVPDFKDYYEMYISKKINKTEMAKKLKVSRPTIDRLIKDFEKTNLL